MPVGIIFIWVQARKHCHFQDLENRGYNIGIRSRRNVRRIGGAKVKEQQLEHQGRNY